jgi:hypothetical protein
MVVDDPERAAAVVAAGGLVVLLADPAVPAVPWPEGPGRMALLVGGPADPVAWAAASSMDRELFGVAAGG